jgi:glutamate-1-semialdehyde 2,1-aminomutase
MKTVAIVQARLGSIRLPNKVLRDLGGRTVIGIILERLKRATSVDEIVLATGDSSTNDPLVEHVEELGFRVFRGSEPDVLERYYGAALMSGADTVVRITGDCPLVDPALVDVIIGTLHREQADYASNTLTPTYPDGLDVEAFTFRALHEAQTKATSAYDREHVTPYLKRDSAFGRINVRHDTDLSSLRWTVDEPEDLVVIDRVFDRFAPDIHFSWRRVESLYRTEPELFDGNQQFIRDEGATMEQGQKLWKRAKRVIAGGTLLLSKRPEMHLPGAWPTYYSRAKGCRVWDLAGKEYVDTSLMGVGTNVLGYGHAEVDDAVRGVIDAGNLSTLNCPEEVYLAERLVEMHPWASAVRFARTGGEANAVAVRLARAASGRDVVAMCGYHGWHDWYLAANLGDSQNLDGHLLPGLLPKGVPRTLKDSVLPFAYNRIDQLEALVAQHEVGVIFMEVMRNQPPAPGFLERVREIATAKGIVLVFDECTSGFRESFGGLHLKYGVDPDVAIFGKTISNGYALTAIVGRRDVMEQAQSSFISSTFWTERIGPTAALKTLEVMERERSWETITGIGQRVIDGWRTLADAHGLRVTVNGLPALAGYAFDSPSHLAYKTLVTQEMLAAGFLATTALYACVDHTPEILDPYFTQLDQVFGLIRQCEDGRDVMGLLKGPVCDSGFRRLN